MNAQELAQALENLVHEDHQGKNEFFQEDDDLDTADFKTQKTLTNDEGFYVWLNGKQYTITVTQQ